MEGLFQAGESRRPNLPAAASFSCASLHFSYRASAPISTVCTGGAAETRSGAHPRVLDVTRCRHPLLADCHPGNILVGRGARIGLLDYGQSKALSSDQIRSFATLIHVRIAGLGPRPAVRALPPCPKTDRRSTGGMSGVLATPSRAWGS